MYARMLASTVSVEMPLRRSAFELVNPAMQRVIEPGEFEIQAGASSEDIRQVYLLSISESTK